MEGYMIVRIVLGVPIALYLAFISGSVIVGTVGSLLGWEGFR